jgi:hypothetical protein
MYIRDWEYQIPNPNPNYSTADFTRQPYFRANPVTPTPTPTLYVCTISFTLVFCFIVISNYHCNCIPNTYNLMKISEQNTYLLVGRLLSATFAQIFQQTRPELQPEGIFVKFSIYFQFELT